MTNSNLHRVINVVGIVISVSGVLMLIVGLWASADPEPVEKFKVVDRYENCDVVRYTDHTNRWNYLLHCP